MWVFDCEWQKGEGGEDRVGMDVLIDRQRSEPPGGRGGGRA
jgi:hypothetical protein